MQKKVDKTNFKKGKDCSYREGLEELEINYFTFDRFICIMVRVFANGPGDRSSIPGGV